MKDCIFCKIVSGELPSSKTYEDDLVIAFLDIMPVNPGHTLVAPKEHYNTPLETPDETLSRIVLTAKKIAPAIARATNATGFNITFNNGTDAGQAVPHTHLHIIPRDKSDGLKLWPQKPYPEGEQEKLAQKIRLGL